MSISKPCITFKIVPPSPPIFQLSDNEEMLADVTRGQTNFQRAVFNCFKDD